MGIYLAYKEFYKETSLTQKIGIVIEKEVNIPKWWQKLFWITCRSMCLFSEVGILSTTQGFRLIFLPRGTEDEARRGPEVTPSMRVADKGKVSYK